MIWQSKSHGRSRSHHNLDSDALANHSSGGSDSIHTSRRRKKKKKKKKKQDVRKKKEEKQDVRKKKENQLFIVVAIIIAITGFDHGIHFPSRGQDELHSWQIATL